MGNEDWTKAEAYWREQHARQSYAREDFSHEHYAPAYRTGHEATVKHAGKKFEEIEDDLALNYERAQGRAWSHGRGEPSAE